jgi:hypothetical protein
MAFDESNGGNGMYMPVAPAYMGGYGNNGFGGDWAWIIILLLCGWGNGFGGMGGWGGMGNMMLGYDFPWLMNGQQNIMSNDNGNYRDARISDGITSVRDGIAGLSNQLCNCCHDMSAQMYNNEIASLNRSFDAQTATTQGFFGVQQGISDLRYTEATEACATRNASAMNTRDIIDSQTRGTQAILDKLCQQELDAERRENQNLRSELMYARGQASQVDQTAQIRASQATVANQLVNELRSCPIPAQPVYGNQPIFTCNNGNSCGCGCNGGF